MDDNEQVVETEEVVAEEVTTEETTETPDAGAEETASEQVAAPETAGEVVETPEQIANRKINDKIAKHKYEARRAQEDAEYWKRRAQPEPEPQAPAEPTEPTIEQFETYDDFIVAKAEFAAEKKFSSMQTQQVQHTQRQAYESKKQTVIAKGNTDHEDFYTVTSQIPLSEYAMAAATELENGSEAVYYLGKNPTEATRIYGLSPVQQVMELNNISNRLAKPAAPTTTKAPEPITPISTEGNTDLKYHPNMSQSDYAKLRQERKKAAGVIR